MQEFFRYKPRVHQALINPAKCVAGVSDRTLVATWRQCRRNQWKGEWCRQHRPESIVARGKIPYEHHRPQQRLALQDLEVLKNAYKWRHEIMCPAGKCTCGLAQAQVVGRDASKEKNK